MEVNYFFEQIIKKYGLGWGIFMLLGMQGAGKTSLGTAWLRADYARHSERRIKDAITHYKRRGLNLAELPEVYIPTSKSKKVSAERKALPNHLYYSNVDIALKGTLWNALDEYKTHKVTAKDICLPDGVNPFQYFPYGSVIFLQEASDSWHAYDWQRLGESIRLYMKYIRHNNITLIIDSHSNSDIAKQLRTLATDEFRIQNRLNSPARFFGLIKPHVTWYFKHSLPQDIAWAQSMGEDISKYTHNSSFRTKDNVYEAYDSESGEMLFLRGIYKYGFATRKHPPRSYTADGIETYCKEYDTTTEVQVQTDKNSPTETKIAG